MRRVIFFLFLIIHSVQVGFAQKQVKHYAGARLVYSLNTNWAFYRGDIKGASAVDFNDADWYAVTIPHTMRLEQKHNGGANVYQGVGWYRRYFKADKYFQGKRVVLNFDGVQINCEV